IEKPHTLTKPRRVLLTDLDGTRFVDPEEIILCRALDNYTSFHLPQGEKRIVSKTLKQVEQMLKPFSFFRSHQSYLINLKCVKEFIRADGGKILLSEGLEANLSRINKDLFFEKLKELDQ
ncbi:MAG: LytTR family DNA-binding domain-containing protein, partial [Bacteroidota bacterium]